MPVGIRTCSDPAFVEAELGMGQPNSQEMRSCPRRSKKQKKNFGSARCSGGMRTVPRRRIRNQTYQLARINITQSAPLWVLAISSGDLPPNNRLGRER